MKNLFFKMKINSLEALKNTISVLKSPGVLGLLLIELVLFLGLQFLFLGIQNEKAESVNSLIGSMLRDESLMSKSYLLAQSIEDMQKQGVLICARLSKIDGSEKAMFYDSSFRESCQDRLSAPISLKGLDGHQWEIQVATPVSWRFNFIKWMTYLIASGFILGLYWALQTRVRREKEYRLKEEAQRKFLQDFNNQIVHDMASPLTALNFIADNAPLGKHERDFLKEAVWRTEGLFQTLKHPVKADSVFSVRQELQVIVREKQLVLGQFPQVEYTFDTGYLDCPKLEFSRVISNILNNAIEAGAKAIRFRIKAENQFVILIIDDDGAEIPNLVVERLGSSGNSIGKVGGQGRGLLHAFNFMRSIGGNLQVSSSAVGKIQLKFPSSQFSLLSNKLS